MLENVSYTCPCHSDVPSSTCLTVFCIRANGFIFFRDIIKVYLFTIYVPGLPKIMTSV